MGRSKIDIVKHPSILEHHSLPKVGITPSQSITPSPKKWTPRAPLCSIPAKNFTVHCRRWRCAEQCFIQTWQVTIVQLDSNILSSTLLTNQYSIQYYPIVINAIHCYSILSTSSAPTEILWAFQTSPGELFKSWKVPTLSPVPGSYTTWITVHQSSQREKNGVVANISI